MHEYSLMQTLLAQVRDIARAQAAARVAEVSVTVGPLSGVEALLMESAFAQLAVDELFQGARLAIEPVPLTLACDSCRHHSSLMHIQFSCPLCGSTELRIIGGDAVILRYVVLDVPHVQEAQH
jgi:hydrogenase nickel incorporation protein HypA/HybF